MQLPAAPPKRNSGGKLTLLLMSLVPASRNTITSSNKVDSVHTYLNKKVDTQCHTCRAAGMMSLN